jgi:hypothetical protein
MTTGKPSEKATSAKKGATTAGSQKAKTGIAGRTSATKAATKTPSLPGSGKDRQKLVRDSFTIPRAEYAVLESLKARAANLKRPAKKSELLRAGVAALQRMSDQAFLSVLKDVPSLKTGRPKAALDEPETI